MSSIKDKRLRKEIIKKALFCNLIRKDDAIKERIKKAIVFKDSVIVSEEMRSYMEELLLKDRIISHRADVSLFYASRAYAAYLGDETVKKAHIDRVYPLVILHRKGKAQNRASEEIEQQEKNRENSYKEQKNKESKTDENKKTSRNISTKKNIENVSGNADIERIFPVGSPFKIRRLIFEKDRIFRNVSGKRTNTKTKKRTGRYVKHILKENDDIAIDATIRASALYQKRRGRAGRLIIKDEDLRFKQREKKMSHLFLFVVDGSGSMAAQKRIIEAKAAIQSLLMDCYQRRDRVSMILFRKDGAEVVLPPTSSLEVASQKLKELPTGGATPLSAGLLEAYKLIKQSILKDKELRVVLFVITDGRANKAIKCASAWDEVKDIACGISSIPQVESIVVDTEPEGFVSMGLSKELARLLEARYLKIEELKQEIMMFSHNQSLLQVQS
jgi:magnesium chelatase subunit D